MGKYIIRRLISMIITLVFVASITFFLMHAVPGGPFQSEKALPEAVIQALNEKYHLDDPLWKQYLDYMKGVFTFQLGPSFKRVGTTVNDLIIAGFPYSAKLGFFATLAIVALGIPAGIISALKTNKWEDYLVTVLATLGVAVPSFVLGALFIYIFSSRLGWLPSFGLTSWKHYIGPVIALSGFSLAFVARLTRSSVLEVMQQDYIRTARAKGLPEIVVIVKHALKNALIPVVTYLGPMIAAMMTGSFIVEKIFAIPGMGKYFVESVSSRDYTVLMGTTIFYAAFSITMIFLVDIAYGFIDPRIKLGD
ncbi:ABC transporter permease [Acidaminobacter hydrogenoformans]|uniref:Oligopeptide transport system permease protein n=1 Tax=Acidaminobacter hydrogenoformans DSM 2784 TaxID=1120920 RepID=A0A1G5RZC7_9FIRM|nr:ABC transporter permease [Acidaminobacter hydrogenoformans]SCZ78811.1 oligopeptide transport system permease protein [Acidaminobacter hydrogenoformans DSM 2784]